MAVACLSSPEDTARTEPGPPGAPVKKQIKLERFKKRYGHGRLGKLVLRGFLWLGMMVVEAWGNMRRMGRAQASPLREGGAARRKEKERGLCLGSEWKGRWGSTAVCRRCLLAHDLSAKGLTRLLLERDSACCDGNPQYSPRRGPCHLSFAMHGHPIHGRTTPLSEGGAGPLLAPCIRDVASDTSEFDTATPFFNPL